MLSAAVRVRMMNETKQKDNKNNNQTDFIIGVLLWVTMVEWSGNVDG
jgi:hypothetical protein